MGVNSITVGGFKTTNNKLHDHQLPPDILREAVNVRLDNSAHVIMPGWGRKKIYSGTNCHSYHANVYGELFVENGLLKRLNADNTATALRSGMGDSRVFYTSISSDTYFCNESVTGIFNGLTNTVGEWGTARPPRQPDLSASSVGGLFAGDYRVAITWRGSTGVEGGTGNSKRIVVPEGGGIALTNFPQAPAFVTMVAVWVSSVNGRSLYLYGEYPANVDYVNIGRLTEAGVEPTIKLTTQFSKPPMPKGKIIAHMGRIYYAVEDKVYYTDTRRLGLQRPLDFFPFDSKVTGIIAAIPFLYIVTESKFYSVTNCDAATPPILNQIKNFGNAAVGSEVSGPDATWSYIFCDHGVVKVNADGSTEEPTYQNNALLHAKNGTGVIMEKDGERYLVYCLTDVSANNLADPEYDQLGTAA